MLIVKRKIMKTIISITQKSVIEEFVENLKEFVFKFYCFFRTIINNRKMLGEVFWSNSDCYIEIGKSGYISNGKMFDLNGDITSIKEIILTEKESLKLNFSESEINKIKNLANKKNIGIKELLLTAIDKFQQTDTITTE